MAMLLRLCCFLVAFCFATTKLVSQTAKPDYALLWEVSRNDLPESCYLFGTMHLRDERVFELCDSVLLAIEAVDAFAMEVHPDSALSYVINLSMNDRDTFNELRETLSEDAYEEVEELLNRKANTSLDELKSKNPKLVEQMLKGIKELPFSKKRPQILDLTLFSYANGRGKNMFGLERMSEYSDLTKAFFEIFEDSIVAKDRPPVNLNGLIETYRTGNIDALKVMVNDRFSNENYRRELLTNRNIRMVDKMIGHGRRQSIFCAVGAAHLPGEDGMLALLRNKGYQVRRVYAHFTGVADSLFEANKPIPTQLTFKDEGRGFSALLPTEPQVHWARQQLEDDNNMTTKLYIAMDLHAGREYTIAVFDYPPSLVFTDKQAVFNTAIENYELQWGPQIGESRTVYVDGFLGSASKYRTQGSYINVQGTMRGTRFYTFATTHPVGTSDSSSQAFFKSVRLLPLNQSPLLPTELPEIGCTLALPSSYHLKADTSEAQVTYSYSSGDTLASNNYILTETILSKYFETETPDSFLINYRQKLVGDSSFTVKDTLFGSMPSFYLTSFDTANLNFTEHLVMLTDTGVYELIVNKAAPDTSGLAWAFFNSFKPKRQWTGALLKRETTQLLLDDLASEDTLVAQQAKDALYEHEIQDEDLTAIFNALQKPMPLDTMPWGSTHGMLISKLEDRKDERLLPFLVAYFHDNKAMRYRQRNALQVMLSMQDSAAYNAYFELAPTVDTADGLDIPFYGHLNFLIQDSALVLELLPRLFPLRKHPAYNYMVYNAISNSIRAKWGDRSGFHPYAADIVKDAWAISDANRLLAGADSLELWEDRWDFINLLDIAGYLPAPAGSVDLLKKMQALPDAWMLNAVVVSLIRHGEKLDKSALNKIHDLPYAWHTLLETLHLEGWMDKIPSKMLDLETYIEGGIPYLMDGEIESVADFKIIEKRKHIHQGEEVWLYVFSFKFDETEEDSYIGICSQPKSGKLTANPAIFDVSYDTFDGGNMEALIEEVLGYY